MLLRFHRISALIIVTFVIFHLINHLLILAGVQQHIDFMESYRLVYRNVVAESVLLACVVFQIISGVYFVWKAKGQCSGLIAKAQVIAGLYLAYFLVNHVGAVFYGRFFTELDTNIYYGIAGLHVNPFQFYFIPYYFFAVVALFVHIASAINSLTLHTIKQSTRIKLVCLTVIIGIVISMTLMLGFTGMLYDIQIPPEYRAFYE